MIQLKQPKKTKAARRKARQEVLERLQLKYPTWFEGKTDKEIRDTITAFRLSKKDDDEFPNFCIKYEAEQEQLKSIIKETANKMMNEYDKYFDELTNALGMRDATPEENQNVQDHIDEISKPTDVNFNDFFDGTKFLEYCENKINETCKVPKEVLGGK